MDKEAILARFQKIIKMYENQLQSHEKINYEESKKKADEFEENLNKCAMLDGELEKIKSEFKNGNISEDDYNKKIEKYIKQVIKILK
jgi:hypothetical protein